MPSRPPARRDVPIKHSVRVAGHATSISLEPVFWELLAELAKERQTSINRLVSEIDARRSGNLSSAIRVYLVEYLRETAASQASHEASSKA